MDWIGLDYLFNENLRSRNSTIKYMVGALIGWKRFDGRSYQSVDKTNNFQKVQCSSSFVWCFSRARTRSYSLARVGFSCFYVCVTLGVMFAGFYVHFM